MILDENLFEDVDTKELLNSQQSEKMSEVEDNAKEVQNPVYADAIRQMKQTAKVKADTIKVEKEPKREEKPKKPKMNDGAKKLKLNEDFYHDEDEEGICPACGGLITYDEIDDEHLVIEDTETAYYNCKCKNCDTHYREYHEIQLNFSHYQPVESLKAKMARKAQRDPLDEALNEYSKLNWRGVEGVKLIDHGAYSDPELFYKDEDGTKYYANYWNVEDSMWEYFLEETGLSDAESGKPEVEEAFDKFCQEHRDCVISDIMDMAKPMEESLNEDVTPSVGERIAQVLADAIGTHGAFGEETVEAAGNTIKLVSQTGVEEYKFNDDGSVDFVNVDEAVEAWKLDDPEMTDEEAAQMKEEYAHFDSVLDLLNGSGTTWFMDLDSDVEEEINTILKSLNENITDTQDLVYRVAIGTSDWNYQYGDMFTNLDDAVAFVNEYIEDEQVKNFCITTYYNEDDYMDDWIVEASKTDDGTWHVTPNTSDSYTIVDGKLVRNALTNESKVSKLEEARVDMSNPEKIGVENLPDFDNYCITDIDADMGPDWDIDDWTSLDSCESKSEAIKIFNKWLKNCEIGGAIELHGIDYDNWYDAMEQDCDVYTIIAVRRISENEYVLDDHNAYDYDCDFDIIDGKLVVL